MCYVETQNKTPSSGYCKGFLIYLRLSFAAAPHGAVFFCYPQACKKLYHAYACLGFLILACTIYILAPTFIRVNKVPFGDCWNWQCKTTICLLLFDLSLFLLAGMYSYRAPSRKLFGKRFHFFAINFNIIIYINTWQNCVIQIIRCTVMEINSFFIECRVI